MNPALFLVALAALVALRLWRRQRRRAAAGSGDEADPAGHPRRSLLGALFGDVGLVAEREVRERTRGRVFRIGTLVILLAVAAAIVIPKLTHSSSGPQQVGVVGPLSAGLRHTIDAAGVSAGTAVRLVQVADEAAAERRLRDGTLDLAVVDGRRLIVNQAITANSTSTTAGLAQAVAQSLGVDRAVLAAGLTPAQLARLATAPPLPISSLEAAPAHQRAPATGPGRSTAIIGVILLFVMLSQYNTWILTGVMEEKSSRVVEVLLAAVRPMRLLAGKVLGIGLVAFGQAALIVGFALVLAEAVGSNLLHGTAPVVLVSALFWLVLGYAFYCWVFAAAGSMAERQDQVQSLAFPLSLPIIVAYILALTAAASGTASTFFKVLAYLPPTAPFAMPVLVGLDLVTWWEFAISAVICVAGTVAVARVAAGVYQRAILRTGRQVRLREVLSRSSG